jgi:hypothetical protein
MEFAGCHIGRVFQTTDVVAPPRQRFQDLIPFETRACPGIRRETSIGELRSPMAAHSSFAS